MGIQAKIGHILLFEGINCFAQITRLSSTPGLATVLRCHFIHQKKIHTVDTIQTCTVWNPVARSIYLSIIRKNIYTAR